MNEGAWEVYCYGYGEQIRRVEARKCNRHGGSHADGLLGCIKEEVFFFFGLVDSVVLGLSSTESSEVGSLFGLWRPVHCKGDVF